MGVLGLPALRIRLKHQGAGPQTEQFHSSFLRGERRKDLDVTVDKYRTSMNTVAV